MREARKYKGISGNNQQRKAEGAARTESAGGGATTPNRMRYTGPFQNGGPAIGEIDYAAMRAKFGRKGTDERLGNHEFLRKGKGDTIFFW